VEQGFGILALLIVAGAAAAFINALASSGSAITLPLLIFIGLPVHVANATNRLPVLVGSIAAIIAFHRGGVLDWRNGLILLVPTFLGTFVGALAALELSEAGLTWVVIGALLVALVLSLTNGHRIVAAEARAEPRIRALEMFVFFLVGFWKGFVVLDSATYALLALVLLVGYDLIRANAVKSLLLAGTAPAGLGYFAFEGVVDWESGIALALGSVGGGYVAAKVASRPEAKVWVFRVLLVVIGAELVSFAIKYGA